MNREPSSSTFPSKGAVVVHFKSRATGIACGDTEATLAGEALGDDTIEGSDLIRMVGCESTDVCRPKAASSSLTR